MQIQIEEFLNINQNEEKYQLLKESFVNLLYGLEKSGVIEELIILDQFKENKNIKEFSLLPHETFKAEEFAKNIPYDEDYQCKNLSLVSCKIKGKPHYKMSLGVILPYHHYANANDAFGLGICCKFGEEVFIKRYISSSDARNWAYYTINEATKRMFTDFGMLITKAKKLQEGK